MLGVCGQVSGHGSVLGVWPGEWAWVGAGRPLILTRTPSASTTLTYNQCLYFQVSMSRRYNAFVTFLAYLGSRSGWGGSNLEPSLVTR